ncbi:MAG: N5-glutamine methyltransferase family protein, partial [Methylocella sp.]
VGSGAILGALLHSLPNAFGVGVDISPAACAIARNNLAANGFAERGSIVCGDWAAPLRGGFDIIVSNPPYIRGGDLAGLAPEVVVYDPRLALDGGGDGLDAYRAIIPAAAELLAQGGLLALEFGLGQGDDVAGLLRAASFGELNFRLDLNGRKRIISARRA